MALILNENSYITVIDADAFFADSIYFEQWDALTADQKSRGLITATSILDKSYIWNGWKTDETQFLEWPRDDIWCRCDEVDNSIVPRDILNAVCILALLINIDNPLAINSVDVNIKKAKLDVMEVEYFNADDKSNEPVIPNSVSIFIKQCYGTLRRAGQNLRTTRA
jgi:hypothetical protein